MVNVFRSSDFIFAVFFIGALIYYSGVRNEEVPKGEVRLPSSIILIGGICGAFFSFFSIAASFDTPLWEQAPIWALAIFNSGVLSGLVLSLVPIMIITKYDSAGVTKRNLIGKKRSYSWNDLTEVEDLKGDVRLWFGKKRISIDEMSEGCEELTAYAQARYRQLHNCALPFRPVSKYSLFRGHVKNPGGFVFVYLLVYILLLGFLTVAAIDSRPLKSEELSYAVITPTEYEISAGDLKIYAGDDLPYVLNDYKKNTKNADRLIHLVGSGRKMEVSYIGHEDAKENPRRTLYSIAAEEGEIFRSLEMSNDLNRKDLRIVIIIIGVLLVLWTVYCILSIKVGRDPYKYSDQTVRFFFKDGYIS